MATLSASKRVIPAVWGKCVSYLREGNRPYSRLNADAQRRTIAAILPPQRSKLIGEFVEQEPLNDNQRPAFFQALQVCQDENALLLIGQIDRMRSAVHWLGHAKDRRVRFRGVDAPHINYLTYYALVFSDEGWRRDLGSTVRDSLIAAKERGLHLGGDRGCPDGLKLGPAASAKVRLSKAMRRDRATWVAIEDIRYRGVVSLTGIAKRLNQMGLRAPRGGNWSPAQVRTVIQRFENEQT